jgi:hypothetical protein
MKISICRAQWQQWTLVTPKIVSLTQFLCIRCSVVNCLYKNIMQLVFIVEHYSRTQSCIVVQQPYQVHFLQLYQIQISAGPDWMWRDRPVFSCVMAKLQFNGLTYFDDSRTSVHYVTLSALTGVKRHRMKIITVNLGWWIIHIVCLYGSFMIIWEHLLWNSLSKFIYVRSM